jgi:hypothetical protein
MIFQWDFFLIASIPEPGTDCDKYDNRRSCDRQTILSLDIFQFLLVL